MPLINAKCVNCGGLLEVDESKEAAVCPFCNTPYIVEKAVNLYKTEHNVNISVADANINISNGKLDADTMFENWLVTRSNRLREDFEYYYATDQRLDYFKKYDRAVFCVNQLSNIRNLDVNTLSNYVKEITDYLALTENILVGPRFEKYLQAEKDQFLQAKVAFGRAKNERLEAIREQERLHQERQKIEKRRINIIFIGLLIFLGGLIIMAIIKSYYDNNISSNKKSVSVRQEELSNYSTIIDDLKKNEIVNLKNQLKEIELDGEVYSYAEFDEFNSYASVNGHGDEKHYVYGETTQILIDTEHNNIVYCDLITEDGDIWSIVFFPSEYIKDKVLDCVNNQQNVIILGTYSGFSDVKKKPVIEPEYIYVDGELYEKNMWVRELWTNPQYGDITKIEGVNFKAPQNWRSTKN